MRRFLVATAIALLSLPTSAKDAAPTMQETKQWLEHDALRFLNLGAWLVSSSNVHHGITVADFRLADCHLSWTQNILESGSSRPGSGAVNHPTMYDVPLADIELNSLRIGIAPEYRYPFVSEILLERSGRAAPRSWNTNEDLSVHRDWARLFVSANGADRVLMAIYRATDLCGGIHTPF